MDLAVFFHAEGTKATGGVDGGQGADFAGGLVGSDAGVDVDGGQSVAVGKQKRFARRDVALDGFDAEGGHGILPGIGQGDIPVLLIMIVVTCDFGGVAEFEGDVAGVPQVVAEVVFDHVALVAEAEDEVLVPVLGIGFHDVPEDGFAPDGDHGFGAKLGFFAEAGALSAAEDDYFHALARRLGMGVVVHSATVRT